MWHKIINNWKYILVGIIIVLAPILLNFILLLQIGIPEQLIVGDSKLWLSFWPTYFSALGTFAMAIMTYKTLKQNDKLIKEQNTPKLSCSLAIGNDCLYIEIKNSASVPAHGAKVSLAKNTTKESIFDFDTLCNHLAQMSFDISPFETKLIPIRGIQPYGDGKYDGYLTATVSYNDKMESFKLYLSEINVTAWTCTIYDVCKEIKNINSTIKDIKNKI